MPAGIGLRAREEERRLDELVVRRRDVGFSDIDLDAPPDAGEDHAVTRNGVEAQMFQDDALRHGGPTMPTIWTQG